MKHLIAFCLLALCAYLLSPLAFAAPGPSVFPPAQQPDGSFKFPSIGLTYVPPHVLPPFNVNVPAGPGNPPPVNHEWIIPPPIVTPPPPPPVIRPW